MKNYPVKPLLVIAALLFGNLPAFSQRTIPSAYSSNVRPNYVRTWDVVAPISVSDSITTSTVITKARMTTQFIDGVGRPIQTVTKKGSLATDSANLTSSTNAIDAVSSIQYDEFGRVVFQYLPCKLW